MPIFTSKQRNVIIIIIIILLGCFLIYALRGLFSAILGSVVLYTIFRSVYLKMVNKWKIKRPISTVLLILFSLFAIIIPFLSLSIMVINKISQIKADSFPVKKYLSIVQEFASTKLKQPHLIDDAMQKLGNFAAQLFPSILSGAAGIFLTITIMYFLVYFMFTDYERFERGLLRYSPFKKEHARKFARELKNTTYSNVLGQGLIAFVQGGLLALSFWITGVPDAVFWGVIGMFMSFVPIIGAPTLSIPAGIIQLANGHTWQGIFILAFGVVVIANIDNVLRLIINRRMGDTHPIITIIGVIIGLPVFGILGLVFGPLLISYFLLLIEIYEQNEKDAQDKTYTPPNLLADK